MRKSNYCELIIERLFEMLLVGLRLLKFAIRRPGAFPLQVSYNKRRIEHDIRTVRTNEHLEAEANFGLQPTSPVL